jgi:hypothetical protein
MESRPQNMGEAPRIFNLKKKKKSCVWTVVSLQGLPKYLVYELWFKRFGPFKQQEGEEKLRIKR